MDSVSSGEDSHVDTGESAGQDDDVAEDAVGKSSSGEEAAKVRKARGANVEHSNGYSTITNNLAFRTLRSTYCRDGARNCAWAHLTKARQSSLTILAISEISRQGHLSYCGFG